MERALHYILVDHIPVALDCSTEAGPIEWAQWMQDYSRRRIGVETVGPFWIRIVFLGLDQQYFHGPPILFETMIFEQEEDPTPELLDDNIKLIDHIKSKLDHLRWQYSTWEEAEQGHQDVIGMVRRSMLKDHKWWSFVNHSVKNKPVCR